MWKCCGPASRFVYGVPTGRAPGVADRLHGDGARGGEVLVEERRRHLQHLGDVVEAVAQVVLRQQRRGIDLETEQVAHRVRVFAAVQAMQLHVARVRVGAGVERPSIQCTKASSFAVSGRGSPGGGISRPRMRFTTFPRSPRRSRPRRARACRAQRCRPSRSRYGRRRSTDRRRPVPALGRMERRGHDCGPYGQQACAPRSQRHSHVSPRAPGPPASFGLDDSGEVAGRRGISRLSCPGSMR